MGEEPRGVDASVERHQVAEVAVGGVERIVRRELPGQGGAKSRCAARTASEKGRAEGELVQSCVRNPIVSMLPIVPCSLSMRTAPTLATMPFEKFQRAERKLPRAVAALEDQRQNGRRSYRVVVAGSRQVLALHLARLGIDLLQGVDLAPAAIGALGAQLHAQTEVAQRRTHQRAVAAVPAP